MNLIRRLWARVNEPRIVSVSHALVYLVLLLAGLYALVNPPTTLEGAAGTFSMRLLAGTLAIGGAIGAPTADRKSTRLNSSHVAISYAVFCWKTKKSPACARQDST